jgi:hypothetical protein
MIDKLKMMMTVDIMAIMIGVVVPVMIGITCNTSMIS